MVMMEVQQPEQPQPSNQPLSPKKFFWKRVILLLVVLLLIGGTVYATWAYQNDYFPFQKPSTSPDTTLKKTHTLSKLIAEYPEIGIGLKVTFNEIDQTFREILNNKSSKEKIEDSFIISNDNVLLEATIAIDSGSNIHQAGKFYNHYLQSEIYHSGIVEKANEMWDDPNFKYVIVYSNLGDLDVLKCKPPWLYLFPGQELDPSGSLTPCMTMVVVYPPESYIKLMYTFCYLKTADNKSLEQCQSLIERLSLEVVRWDVE